MNNIKIIKRDGRVVPFDIKRISDAVGKAYVATRGNNNAAYCRSIAEKVTGQLLQETEKASFTVAEIQDLVETALMESSCKDVARRYIEYRSARDNARKAETNRIFAQIIDAQANDITRENANMNADTPAGMMMKFASESTKTYVDENLLSTPEVKAAVTEGYMHIHDKDYYPTKSLTCIQHPTDKLLSGGFKDGHASVRPAKRIETAATLACISLEAVQNEMHGGQAIPAFDFYLAPFVRGTFEEEVERLREVALVESNVGITYVGQKGAMKVYKGGASAGGRFMGLDWEAVKAAPVKDYIAAPAEGEADPFKAAVQLAVNRTVKRVHQAMESFVHNMNTIHSRGGNQVVFSSINYGTDTSAEGRCVIREILNTTYEGVGNGETAIFPIQIWKKKRGVSYLPGDPNYDLYRFATKVTARRFFPNYLNLDASYNKDEAWKADDPRRFEHEVATMGCRTRVYENRFGPKTSIGRGNLSFTTLNLPKMAIECMDIKDPDERRHEFFEKLAYYCDLAARQLDERFRFQATALAKQFPMLMSGMWLGSEKLGPNDRVESVLNQGTLGIGFIGLAECLIALTGKHHGESPAAQDLGLEIVSFMRSRVQGYCEKYQHNYSVLATPAEGLSGKFTKVDRKRYGVIPGVTDKDYYTNSNHVPVYFKCTPEQKAAIEGPYHKLTTGGHIFYVEMDGDATHNPEAIEAIVDLMDRYDIGYGSVNHNRNRCMDCGYEDATKDLKVCPRCGGVHIDTLQRITGYLVGTTNRWNSGKLAELKDRVVHE